jgi:ParB family chromosome partitioning protein
MTTRLSIPLDAIDATALIRDRGPLNPAGLEDLVTSIALIGLSQPVEVWELSAPAPPLRYGLISGLRRLTALRTLRDARGNGDFATIPALLRRALSQTSAVDASGPEPDIAFIQDHQKEAER